MEYADKLSVTITKFVFQEFASFDEDVERKYLGRYLLKKCVEKDSEYFVSYNVSFCFWCFQGRSQLPDIEGNGHRNRIFFKRWWGRVGRVAG